MIRKPGAKGARQMLFIEVSLPGSEQVEKQIWRGTQKIPMTQI